MSSERSSLRRGFPFRALFLAWVLAIAGHAPVGAQPDARLTEYQVEAAFLYHFAKYVTWPPRAFASPEEPIVIGVLGIDPFGDDLVRTVAREKPVQGRMFRVAQSHSAAELARCQILFISASEEGRLAQHFTALQRANSAALTVGESAEFLDAGGMVRFVVENKKVRFEINARAAEAAGISISSKLLNLARNRDRS